MDRSPEPRAAWLKTPARLAEAYAAFEWELAYQYAEHSVVYRLSRGGDTELYLKLVPAGHYPSLAGEAERMRWARGHLPVPEVIEQGREGSTTWLATTPLPGRDGTHPELISRPEELTRILARGLRAFHDTAPVDRCPFDFRLDVALEHVRTRLAAGLIDRARDFHAEFAHLTPDEAVALVEATRPATEDLVVCHGDYCPPNILITSGRATGYVDLGELGVADRWWDLAAATWSLGWNLGPGFEELFLREYDAAPDPERTRFYRLLYDLVC
jgi:kanamycin kinase